MLLTISGFGILTPGASKSLAVLNLRKLVRRIINRQSGKSEKMFFLGLVTVVVAFVVYLTKTDSPESPYQGKVIDRKEFQKDNTESLPIDKGPGSEEIKRNVEFSFADTLHKPEPDAPWRIWSTTTGANLKGKTLNRKHFRQKFAEAGSSRIPLRTIRSTITTQIVSVTITWWDKSIFNTEEDLLDYLKCQLETPFEDNISNYPQWSHRLGIPTFEGKFENEDQTIGSWRIWYRWPSVYYSFQDSQDTRWFGSWFRNVSMLIGGAD